MFSIEAVNDPERRDVVLARLQSANDERSPALRALRGTPAMEAQPLETYAVGGGGELVGGLVGRVQWQWLHVELLWVDAVHRGAGVGSRLVGRAERVAREEYGCIGSQVETWDFQAPEFYRRVGYRLLSSLADYPPGLTNHVLVKAF
ncbi:GNAT family N-acetyltransferase [Streptomyces sp. NPDC001262]|uniref:GNAT family N-acetyltransferase n=1 Tax=Streptomyces TaxID=1883 RepID=UPI00369BA1AF